MPTWLIILIIIVVIIIYSFFSKGGGGPRSGGYGGYPVALVEDVQVEVALADLVEDLPPAEEQAGNFNSSGELICLVRFHYESIKFSQLLTIMLELL